MTTLDTAPSAIDLADRYRPGAGPVTLTGVQAIVRLLVEQHAADAEAGRRSGSFVSGYPGSPLGGLDTVLQRASRRLAAHAVTLAPGLNEELAATAVWGSQLEVPGRSRSVDGAVGVWYGKSPGVDRAGDPMRHGNVSGAHPAGGVLVLAGDDPGCKSSGIPSSSERTLASYGQPVLVPGDAADLVRLGRYGVAASRASGCWVGIKITSDLADGSFTLQGHEGRPPIAVPELEWNGRPWTYRQTPVLAPPASLAAEEQLHGPRWEMLRTFLATNPVDTVEVDPPSPWLTIVAAGKTFGDVRQALKDLGLGDDDLRHNGIRLLRLGAVHPLDRVGLRRAAEGCAQVFVVEEKTPFVEPAVRDALYGIADPPAVLGARDAEDRPLVPMTGELTAATLTGPLRRVLTGRVHLPEPRTPREPLPLLPVARTPYYCSGCPHSRSTHVPDGSLAGGGIGCHAMAAINPQPGAEVTTLPQMGGEGAQWIGQSAFLDDPDRHLFQNIGDGTFAHSGQLAVQACVAAGVDITFKLLHNRAVAMTGGQDVEGGMDVPALTHKLAAEGVRRIIVCADEPRRYGWRPRLAAGTTLWGRDRLDEAQRLLRDVPGVTVLIYDQQCAAEARRGRKRGTVPVRPTRVVINEAVCEGCGDCGAKSNCLSVQPVETELGRKTRIDQGSCNTDYSCLDGDCPSFVTVETAAGPRAAGRTVAGHRAPPSVPDPPQRPCSSDVLLAGIGGTGVVTVNQVLAAAAVHEGATAQGIDQTGLSQKAGPVVSHLRLRPGHRDDSAGSGRVGPAQADCYLAFDLVVAASEANLNRADRSRTAAFASTSGTPTGTQVREVTAPSTDTEELLERVRGVTGTLWSVDAESAAATLFGDTAPAHFLIVGAAVQDGALPIRPAAVETAIEANDVAVAANTDAFRWGRVAIADPEAFRHAVVGRATPAAPSAADHGLDLDPLTGEARRLASIRAAQLVGYQSRRTAEAYLDVLRQVWSAERAVGERTELSEAVARGLHRMVAYKDEYEVARLLTAPEFEAHLAAEVPGGRRMRYRLSPPLLRLLGRRRKVALGPAWRPVLRVLARGKVLRGTPLDPFGHTALRRLERDIRDQYRRLVLDLAHELTVQRYETAVAAARAADEIRGYEDVKRAGVRRYRERLATLGLGDATESGL